MLKKLIIGLSMGVALAACHTKERAQLHASVDSLRTALNESKKVEATLTDVGVLLDSIDANRNSLNTNMVEGTSYSDYTARLTGINKYLKESRTRIAQLEASLKNMNSGYASTIKRLKAEIESRSAQLVVLEQEVDKMRNENNGLVKTVGIKDSTIASNGELIKRKDLNIADLEAKMEENQTQAKSTQADLYFAEAQALETAAGRTRFAPHKKKETKKQALELYKLSLSLGKSEAQTKIDELQKSI